MICDVVQKSNQCWMLRWRTWAKCGNPRQADRPYNERSHIKNNRALSTRLGFKHKKLVPKGHILVEADLGVQVVYEN